ncbi:uncharacterized protein LOC111252136 isoform X2 [Varroa destructor]|nr:uncharacterized protein LOC111252136 isoform X2 [Varroa destructor]XP_022665366.1 uncharacterized protein LOC111252136 isoform X2 [Varroa destructor]XP_022665367.1 uncharacterized protein LOC111252136 isoform X2 [Varroa destructor]XP_022665368.1 uncharacterized protein LOC111252136 isoform X2 [Varroa destructor]
MSFVASSDNSVLARPDGDLCTWMNGRKYYIAVGETGSISAGNVTSQSVPLNDTWSPRIPQRCSIELITCPSCHFEVSVSYLNIPTCSTNGKCRCDYVWVKEPTIGRLGEELCGVRRNESGMNGSGAGTTGLVFESLRKLLSIDFLYSYSYTDAFSLQVTAKSNVYVLRGQADYYQGGSSGYIESPHFPVVYPSDYSVEYQLVNVDPRGYVQLVFTDFQLSPWSYIEVLNTNGSRIDVYNGNTFRPPIIVSAGQNLTVKFRANDEYANAGFRAKYTFVNYPDKYWFNKPNTDCGGIVDDTGGAITMMNMVAQTGTSRAYDCVWLVKSSARETPESQISIRVAQFEEMGPQSTLEIKQGLVSVAYPLVTLNSHQTTKNQQHAQEYTIPASSGFYIRLKGSFTNRSRLAVVYSVFTFDSACNETSQFMCANRRCLHPAIHCDGFNHCGDGSDEVGCDGKVVFEKRLSDEKKQAKEVMQWWSNLTPNYHFPKQDSTEAGNGTNTLILLTSLAGLGMFILTTILILIKLRKQRQIEALNREALRSISEVGDGRRIYPGDIPLFDPPPTYDDVCKFYMPPPPAYSTIDESSPTLARLNTGLPGVENAGFTMISESPPPTYREATHKNNRILRVILPSSSAERRHHRRHKSSPAKAHSAHRRTALRARRSLAALLNDERRRRKPCQCQGACSCPSSSSSTGHVSPSSPPRYQDTRPRPRPPVVPMHVPQDSLSSISSFGSTLPEPPKLVVKEIASTGASCSSASASSSALSPHIITNNETTGHIEAPPPEEGSGHMFRMPRTSHRPPRPRQQVQSTSVTPPIAPPPSTNQRGTITSAASSAVSSSSARPSSALRTAAGNRDRASQQQQQQQQQHLQDKRKSPKRAPIMPLNSRLLAFELDRIGPVDAVTAGASSAVTGSSRIRTGALLAAGGGGGGEGAATTGVSNGTSGSNTTTGAASRPAEAGAKERRERDGFAGKVSVIHGSVAPKQQQQLNHKKEHLCINKWIVRSVDTNGPCVKNASGSTMPYTYVQMIDVNSIFN